MKISDIKVGDYVRFRQWDDMADEYDSYVDSDGDIFFEDSEVYFLRDMSHLCGEELEVVDIHDGDIVSLEGFANESDREWTIMACMLEPAETPPQVEVSTDDLFGILDL